MQALEASGISHSDPKPLKPGGAKAGLDRYLADGVWMNLCDEVWTFLMMLIEVFLRSSTADIDSSIS